MDNPGRHSSKQFLDTALVPSKVMRAWCPRHSTWYVQCACPAPETYAASLYQLAHLRDHALASFLPASDHAFWTYAQP